MYTGAFVRSSVLARPWLAWSGHAVGSTRIDIQAFVAGCMHCLLMSRCLLVHLGGRHSHRRSSRQRQCLGHVSLRRFPCDLWQGESGIPCGVAPPWEHSPSFWLAWNALGFLGPLLATIARVGAWLRCFSLPPPVVDATVPMQTDRAVEVSRGFIVPLALGPPSGCARISGRRALSMFASVLSCAWQRCGERA